MIATTPKYLSQAVPAANNLPALRETRRFTVDGSEALEQRLSELVQRVHRGVMSVTGEDVLQGLLLGGGYGRGEGGVLRTPEGDAPYNDLEFYVFLRGALLKNQRKFQHALHELGEALSHEAGLEVELKVFSLQKLRASPVSMFFYDLFMGHRWVHGGEELMEGCSHHAAAEKIPLHEATRLLMNRCSGLLFSAEQLQRKEFGRDEADFVNRNLHKLRLALGDALLVSHGQYHWSCRERHRRLSQLPIELPWQRDVLAEHVRGVDFKLHPFKSGATRTELEAQHASMSGLAQQVWLWLEGKRMGRAFSSVAEYVDCGRDKCPETNPVRNVLLNLAHFRRLIPTPWRHPRQRVLNALALLLWCPLDQRTLPQLQCLLVTKAAVFPEIITGYRPLWSRFN